MMESNQLSCACPVEAHLSDCLVWPWNKPQGPAMPAPSQALPAQVGVKHDSGKPPMALLPQEALLEVAKVLGFGEFKYGAWNWAKGMKYSRLLSAIYRHLAALQQKLDLDEETGLLHSAHAACGILFLLTYQLNGLGEDDRYDRRMAKKCNTAKVVQ